MRLPKVPGFDQDAFEKYVKNTGWLMVARVGSLVIKICVNIQLANYLLEKKLGILNYPMAIATFFIAAAALGLDGFVTRELIRNPEKEHQLLGTAFVLKFLGGISILPLIYIGYQIINSSNHAQAPFSYVLIVSFTGIFQAFNIIDSYFQSRIQGKFIMQVQIVANLASAGIKLSFILFRLELTYFVYALLFDSIMLAIGYLFVYQRRGGLIKKWTFNIDQAGFLLRNSWPLAFSAVLVTIYMRIDQLMIAHYRGISDLGLYTTVVNWAESWYFIPVAIVNSVFPAIMNARRDDAARYQKRMQNLYDIMVWISVGLAIAVTFAAPLIFSLYDARYAPATSTLTIHIWAGVFVFLSTASGQYLIAEGYTKMNMLRMAAGAAINIILNIFWIPQYGIAGAAFATLVASAVNAFWVLLVPKTHAQGIMMLRALFLITAWQKVKRT